MASIDFVILAAGLGSRMRSKTPKPFQTIAGKPMIQYIIDNCKPISNNIFVIVREDCVNNEILTDVTTVVQQEPKGSADAIVQALSQLKSEHTIVLCGDMPLIKQEYLNKIVDSKEENIIVAMTIPNDLSYMPYGRVILDKHDNFEKIVEYKDANQEERKSNLANTGFYKIKTSTLKKFIKKISNNNQSKEYYLTDLFEILKRENEKVSVIKSAEYWPFHGVNTMEDLARAEDLVQDQLRRKFMENGVKLIDPKSVYFSYDTQIEADVIIEPNVFFGCGVAISRGCKIRAFSHISDCEIMEDVEIGPFARVRGGSKFENGSSIGNFVEVKGSRFGKNSKAKHLAYIGDTSIGTKTNIGAGTITCNYDGVKKHKTLIGDNVFIGSNSTLIAPIEINNNSIVGAGSVITKNVCEDSLAISRAEQREIVSGAIKIWKKKGKL